MRLLDLPGALLLAAYISDVAAAQHRVLRAATRRADLGKREARIAQKFESEVVYVEGENGRETFASSVRVGSRKPILSLEEVEHHLRDVVCGDGRMMLHFADAEAARDAREACHGGHGGTGGLIITSHAGCNDDGERAVYKIDDASYALEGVALDLAVTKTLWQDAFDNIDINFGHTRYDHIYRRHADFSRARKKRQDGLALEIPADTPDNVTDVSFDLTSELLDTTFTAADFLTGLESIVNLPVVPDLPIEIGCTNCSTRGQIVLTQGAIQIDTKQMDFVPDIFEGKDDGKEITSVITGGYMELAVTGLGARLEMFARPVSSGAYEIALFPLPILGFVIPGIGQAGASFEPRISAGFEIDGEVAVGYGIDVAIPDDASVRVALGDLTNTTITGIKGATLNALPFTSNVADADIALSLAFTPTIPIGFEFSDKLSALVTVSLSLPRLDARLTTNAAAQCSLLDKGNKTKPVKNPKPKHADPSKLVLVESNISVSIDVAAELALPLLPAPFDAAATSANIFSTELPLMTACITPGKSGLKVTAMAPVATLKADKAEAEAAADPAATSACTKHEDVKPCTCATATTTVYAAPPTGGYGGSTPTGGYGGSPPRETTPPVEMTPYYPDAPPVETGVGGGEPPRSTGLVLEPYYPEEQPSSTAVVETMPYYPDEQPTPYYPEEQPPSTTALEPTTYYGDQPSIPSTLCTNTNTLRVTISTPPASTAPPAAPPIIIIPSSTPCNSSTPIAPPAAEPTPSTPPYTEDGQVVYPTPPVTVSTLPLISTSTSTAPVSTSAPHSETKSETQSDIESKSETATESPSHPATTSPSTSTTEPHSTLTTTSPPLISESKGFMAPPSSTGTGTDTPPSGTAPATRTAPAEFTGGAAPGYGIAGGGWMQGGWQVGVVVVGLGVGALVV